MEQTKAVQTAQLVGDNMITEYSVAGEIVRLSNQTVRKALVRGNQTSVTDQEIMQFICICKYNQLNPFLNEAYLVKFGNDAQMIVSKEALFKRADACENYEGIQSGIIVKRNGEIVDVEGCFLDDNEVLLGGWAKVYRKDRKYPIVARCSLKEFEKTQATWKTMKATMIAKVAKVQALREAFPNQLGAMYTREEQDVIETPYEEIKNKIENEANKQELPVDVVVDECLKPEPKREKTEKGGDVPF